MNNVELEEKIIEIISMFNYFDMVQAAKEFEKEYKKSDFYKSTRMPLNKVLHEAKIYYGLQLREIGPKVQNLINSLDLNKIENLIDEVTEIFTQENADIMAMGKQMKDLDIFKK